MTKCAPGARLFLLLFLAFSLLGCSQFRRAAVSEEKDPHFLEARKRAKAMDWDGAIEYFERALQNNPTNAAAHFELGVLYDMRKADYGAAIYHYQRHARLRPNSPSAERAENNVVACKRELAKSAVVDYVPPDFQREIERYARTNSLLSQQLASLRAELARRPQYVTNYVTNFVQVPQFEPRGSSRLTAPAPIVQLPESDLEPEPAPGVAAAPKPETQKPLRTTPAPAGRSERAQALAKKGAVPNKAVSRKTHRVKPGDTLDVIARTYGVSIAALKAANPDARNGARAGQQINIP